MVQSAHQANGGSCLVKGFSSSVGHQVLKRRSEQYLCSPSIPELLANRFLCEQPLAMFRSPKSKRRAGQRRVSETRKCTREMQPCSRCCTIAGVTRSYAYRIRNWSLWRDECSGVLIGTGGMWSSDLEECV